VSDHQDITNAKLWLDGRLDEHWPQLVPESLLDYFNSMTLDDDSPWIDGAIPMIEYTPNTAPTPGHVVDAIFEGQLIAVTRRTLITVDVRQVHLERLDDQTHVTRTVRRLSDVQRVVVTTGGRDLLKPTIGGVVITFADGQVAKLPITEAGRSTADQLFDKLSATGLI
jgi:hypothetical protein